MADNKKYYYLKLKENFYDTPEISYLEHLEDGYKYSNIILKMYLRSLRQEGKLMVRGAVPYTPEALAGLTGHDVDTVKKALTLFEELELVTVIDSGAIFMNDIQNFIGESSTEADRKRAYRERIRQEREAGAAGGEHE